MRSKTDKATLTVVTATLNSASTLERCLRSVNFQTERNFVHLVVDGGSSDESVNVLMENGYSVFEPQGRSSSVERYFVSESDGGVYDAMNRGLTLTETSHVIFLNSDDYFFDCHVVHRITRNLLVDQLQIHGICYQEGARERVFRPIRITVDDVILDKSLRRAPHPCIVFPVTDIRYDLRYQLAADYQYVIDNLRIFGQPRLFDECATVMVRSTTQLSVRYRDIMISESKKIAEGYEPINNWKARFNLILWIIKNIFPIFMKKVGFI